MRLLSFWVGRVGSGKALIFTAPQGSRCPGMATVTGFVQFPSDELLNSCTKEQLLKIVEHYDDDIGEKQLKEEIKGSLSAA